MREDILHASRVSIEPGGRGNSRRADPTARKAAELAALDNRAADARLWVQVIEYVIARYEGTPKGRLLEMQYFEELGMEHICNKLLIGRPTYFAWRKELVLCTALAAAELRLIQVCKNMQKV